MREYCPSVNSSRGRALSPSSGRPCDAAITGNLFSKYSASSAARHHQSGDNWFCISSDFVAFSTMPTALSARPACSCLSGDMYSIVTPSLRTMRSCHSAQSSRHEPSLSVSMCCTGLYEYRLYMGSFRSVRIHASTGPHRSDASLPLRGRSLTYPVLLHRSTIMYLYCSILLSDTVHMSMSHAYPGRFGLYGSYTLYILLMVPFTILHTLHPATNPMCPWSSWNCCSCCLFFLSRSCDFTPRICLSYGCCAYIGGSDCCFVSSTVCFPILSVTVFDMITSFTALWHEHRWCTAAATSPS